MSELIIISERNVSLAWTKAFLRVYQAPGASATPIVVSTSGFLQGAVEEIPEIRNAVDDALQGKGCLSCKMNAELIFPQALWQRMREIGRAEFYRRYRDDIYPRLRARDKIRNGKGTYFLRMIGWGLPARDCSSVTPINQLEHIIELYTKGSARGQRPRMSAMQIACFDPARDHTKAVRSIFPCLQQIGLTYGPGGTLSLTAYYPSQYVFDRGYGNYLGLSNLGNFLAGAMELRFDTLRCYVGSPKLGDVTKEGLRTLATILQSYIGQQTLEGSSPQ